MSLEHPSETPARTLSRRAFLRHTALGTAALALLPHASAEAQERADRSPYAPFRMGIQSYSLRAFKLDDALAKTQALGLKYWEAFDSHLPITDDPQKLAEYKDKLKAHDIRLVTYGVVGFSDNEADARKKFEFAKAMGIQNLSADPSPAAFSLLDKLCDEYKINIGIHNHGPGSRYDKDQKILDAIKDHNPRIGACDDTGHFLRSDEDPVAAAKAFGKRLYGVHLKDVKVGPNGEKQFTEIGKGKLDTVALLQVLKAGHFGGLVSLEYEEHAQDPMPYIEECFAAVREAVKKVNGKSA